MHARLGRYFLAFGLSLAACGREDVTGPVVPPGPDASRIVLSAPVPRVAIEGGAASGTVVYVSAVPGSFARGERALLGLKRAAASSAVPVAGGGFDAAALVAEAGDEVIVTIVDSAGGRVTETATARAPARPRVVRTSPGPRRTDVPLNIVITVAFSAPMDTVSVAAALHLSRSGEPVPGTVVFDEEDRTIALFVPDDALAPSTEYSVLLDDTARDVLGQAVDASLSVTFSTGSASTVAPVRNVTIDPIATTTLRQGQTVLLTATACAQEYRPCEEVVAPISWRSSDPDVVEVVAVTVTGDPVPARAQLTARSSGRASVTATAGGVEASIGLFVISPPPASLSANEIVFARTNLHAIRTDGTGLRQLTTGGYQSEPSVAADGRIVFVESPGQDPYARRLGIREVDGSVRYLPLPSPQTWWPPRCPAWSPDMRYIAYLEVAPFYDSGILRVVHADSTTAEVAVSRRTDMTCPKWSPSGQLVAANVAYPYDGPLWGGGWLIVQTLAGIEVDSPRPGLFLPGQWSPDGSAVVAILNDWEPFGSSWVEEYGFWVERRPMNGGAGQRLWLLSGWSPLGEVPPPAWSPDGTLIAFGPVAGRVLLIDATNRDGHWWGETLVEGAAPTFVPPGVNFTR